MQRPNMVALETSVLKQISTNFVGTILFSSMHAVLHADVMSSFPEKYIIIIVDLHYM